MLNIEIKIKEVDLMFRTYRFSTIVVLACACAFFTAGNAFSQKKMSTTKTNVNVNGILAGWSGMPRETATKLIAKYGQPDEATPSMLVWNNNGEWKRTVLYRDEIQHSFPAPHTDFLE